eukprot:Hpha_TRINITY_DN24051_c0_g1::TRINITY_DN24051_c0_g1_i1::g.130430::m.130430
MGAVPLLLLLAAAQWGGWGGPTGNGAPPPSGAGYHSVLDGVCAKGSIITDLGNCGRAAHQLNMGYNNTMELENPWTQRARPPGCFVESNDTGCPWQNDSHSGSSGELECWDGSFCAATCSGNYPNVVCTGWYCCDKHGGRKRCPQEYPRMCDTLTGATGDYECEEAGKCTERPCTSSKGLWYNPLLRTTSTPFTPVPASLSYTSICEDTLAPTAFPTHEPSPGPTFGPISSPPTAEPSTPSAKPTATPTKVPIPMPTVIPTTMPTTTPVFPPTVPPTLAPSNGPSQGPLGPSNPPTMPPSDNRVRPPSAPPTLSPSLLPSETSSKSPLSPSLAPTPPSPSSAPSITILAVSAGVTDAALGEGGSTTVAVVGGAFTPGDLGPLSMANDVNCETAGVTRQLSK